MPLWHYTECLKILNKYVFIAIFTRMMWNWMYPEYFSSPCDQPDTRRAEPYRTQEPQLNKSAGTAGTSADSEGPSKGNQRKGPLEGLVLLCFDWV